MHVDHIIPERLLDEPDRLAGILKELGLPATFNINSYENWMPACAEHNIAKRTAVFEPSPMIQLVLQEARSKADLARQAAERLVTKRDVAKAVNTLMRALKADELDPATLETIKLGVLDVRGQLFARDPIHKSAGGRCRGDYMALEYSFQYYEDKYEQMKRDLVAEIRLTPTVSIDLSGQTLEFAVWQ